MTTLLALISDVHANRFALEAVLADIEAQSVADVHCLGDAVGYGADPNGVIDLLNERGVQSILGNYDDGVGWDRGGCGCFYADEQAARTGAASYAYTVAALTPAHKAYLRGLPRERHLEIEGAKIHLVHGSPRRINEYLSRERDERTFLRLAGGESDDVLAFGHTHDPWFRSFAGKLFVNAGSVGRPKDGDARAAYGLLIVTDGSVQVSIVRVEYDVEAAAASVIAAGLPPELAEGLRRGL